MLKQIGHYSIENPATVYDEEALTALELAGRTAAKVNECVSEVNNIPEKIAADVEKHIEDGDFAKQIDKHTENVVAAVAESEAEMERAIRATEIALEKQVDDTERSLGTRLDALLGVIQPGATPTSTEAEVIDARASYFGDTHPNIGSAIRAQIEKLFNASFIREQLHIRADNYETHMTDANHFNGTIALIQNDVTPDMVANLPRYGSDLILVQFRFSAEIDHGLCQFAFVGNEMYFRKETGWASSYGYTPWKNVATSDAAITYRNLHVRPDNYSTEGFIDANDHKKEYGDIVFLQGSVSIDMVKNLPAYGADAVLIKFRFSNELEHGFVQLFFNAAGDMYYRFESGWGETYTFTPWKIVGAKADVIGEENKLCRIFNHVVCCGDSFTSGHINSDVRNPDYAYPAFMGKMTGSKFVNCGHSGATAITWQTAEYGLPLARSVGQTQAYILGLGLNDLWTSLPIGSASDIGTNAQTYYGGISKIIRELNAISPKAKIFVCTMPRTDAESYNAAVRDIVSRYANTYPVHLLDLYTYRDMYTSQLFVDDEFNGHYTAIGYHKFAENMCFIMSEYINGHIDDFKDVYTIPYNKGD